MAIPAGKESRTGALQPRAQKGRVRRAVRISSLVAQEVGDPLSTLFFSWAGTPRQWECRPPLSLTALPLLLAGSSGFPLPGQPLSDGS